MHEDLLAALASDRCFAGAKLDIRKCFDSVHSSQAIDVLRILGAPEPFLHVLEGFYAKHERWVEWRGCVAPAAIKPTRSLLQGCPGSVMELAALMAVWVRHVKATAPGAKLGVFIDDRSIWTRDKYPSTTLENALRAAAEVDKAADMEWHPDKGEVFAISAPARRELEPVRQLVCPTASVGTKFKMLGVWYHLKKTQAHASRPQKTG